MHTPPRPCTHLELRALWHRGVDAAALQALGTEIVPPQLHGRAAAADAGGRRADDHSVSQVGGSRAAAALLQAIRVGGVGARFAGAVSQRQHASLAGRVAAAAAHVHDCIKARRGDQADGRRHVRRWCLGSGSCSRCSSRRASRATASRCCRCGGRADARATLATSDLRAAAVDKVSTTAR